MADNKDIYNIEKEFNNILRLYNEFINNPNKTTELATMYVGNQHIAITRLCALLDKPYNNVIANYTKTNKFELPYELDDLPAKDAIIIEIEAWGIKEDSFMFRVATTIADISNTNADYEECINQISACLNTSKKIISSTFTDMVKKANFSKTIFIPILTKMPKEQITKEFIVEQLLDFCR